ncbi:MAG TPA: LptF/LptG family permease [Myxococcales bacterium]|nr:LptF/LptG family permease [Myxococcales bacterium]
MFADRLDRHLVRRFLASFAGVLGGVCLLYAIIDFSDRSSAYQGAGWFGWVLRLYGNRLAKVAVQLSPAALLIAAGLTLSSLRHRSELVAALASGRSPARLVLPLFLAAVVAGAAMYEFDDAFAVRAALRAELISAEHFHLWGSYRTNFAPKHWLRLPGRILHVGDPLEGGGFRDVSVLETGPDFSLVRRIDAAAMHPEGGDRFLLEGAEVRTFDGAAERVERPGRWEVELPGAAAIAGLERGKPEMLPRADLRRQIRLRSGLGLAVGEELFEYYGRVAYALTGCAGVLLAAALALRAGRKGHVATTLLEGLLVSAGLWAALGVAKALSISGRLPPAICALLPQALALLVGAGFLVRLQRRTSW